ncbi:MAG TPA: glycoside hydrolase family 76 protein [Polyangiales bacterium]|nr:glycoside hydrolase family 76 protein [Polyangiales bacterium]
MCTVLACSDGARDGKPETGASAPADGSRAGAGASGAGSAGEGESAASGGRAGHDQPDARSGPEDAGTSTEPPTHDAAAPPAARDLRLRPGPDGSWCNFSSDHRQLIVEVQNHDVATAPPTIVEVTSAGTAHALRLETPELAPDQTHVLHFERGPLAGFADPWRFAIAIAPDHADADQRTIEAECADLRSRAAAGMVVLHGFYDQASGLYNGDAWWTGANMLEVTIDYSRETGDPRYLASIDHTFTTVKDGSYLGFRNFLNEYYDDEGWWALAWIKAYDLTHDAKYLDMAKVIFDDMKAGWNPAHCGGGLYWRKTDNTKNAIPNELFLTVAARLHLRTPGDAGSGSYRDWAEREWAWFRASGMLRDDHQIVDGIDRNSCAPGGITYTYNQGVILGGLADLWRTTGDDALLDVAVSIAKSAIAHQTTPDGVFIEAECDPDCGGGDGLQFKGIFARNLAYLYELRPLPEFRAFMIRQSDAIWSLSRSASDQFGKRWAGPFDQADPSRQSSALDAVIGAVRVANMNLALTSTASGSAACSASESAARAIDGLGAAGSKWCAGGTSGQRLELDLQGLFDVVGFRVRHAGAGGEDSGWNTREFTIMTSEDTQAWSPAVLVSGNTASITAHDLPLLHARHVRLDVVAAQTSTELPAARIFELEVLGIAR